MVERVHTFTPEIAPSAVTGCVLCGGQSRRMGRDKAMLELGGAPLVEGALQVLRGISERQLLLSGSTERYPQFGVEQLTDSLPGAGPLGGLLAALEAATTPWVALLGCDQPRVDRSTYRALLAHAEREGAELCLLESEHGLEPTIGVYRRALAGRVRACLEAGERRMISIHASARVATLAIGAGPLEVALNVNTPEDFRRAAELVHEPVAAGEQLSAKMMVSQDDGQPGRKARRVRSSFCGIIL